MNEFERLKKQKDEIAFKEGYAEAVKFCHRQFDQNLPEIMGLDNSGIKECVGINCPKYNSRCIAYGEIPQDCPLFQDNSCVRNCCNTRAENVKRECELTFNPDYLDFDKGVGLGRQLGRDVVLKWLSSHLVKQDDWRLPAFTITQGEFEAQLKDWGINTE